MDLRLTAALPVPSCRVARFAFTVRVPAGNGRVQGVGERVYPPGNPGEVQTTGGVEPESFTGGGRECFAVSKRRLPVAGIYSPLPDELRPGPVHSKQGQVDPRTGGSRRGCCEYGDLRRQHA